MAGIPILDIRPLLGSGAGEASAVRRLAAAIDAACRQWGFFRVVGHGVSRDLRQQLEDQSRAFFALSPEDKLQIRMARGGRAWRGYFPLGAELTSARPDHKEGLYFGAELGDDDPRVRAGTPLHGPNLFPAGLPGLRDAVLEFIEALTALSHRLMEGLARGLGIEPDHFARQLTADLLVLFRIFHYPPLPVDPERTWSVGEHTDYGLLTVLLQDENPGLQVKVGSTWIDVPPVPDSFVCNLGDMFEIVTGGRYRSTPHRVRNRGARGRLSFAFFFDPGFHTRIRPLTAPSAAGADRRDRAGVQGFRGTYGEYLLGKVSRVFPELRRKVL